MAAKTLRLAHVSDIHLDSHGLTINGENESDLIKARFAHVLTTLKTQQPDVMLLAGDLFESNHVQVEIIHWAMDQLDAYELPVVMIPGNHDCLIPDGIYRTHDFNAISNVHLIASEQGELVEFEEHDLLIWGKGMYKHCAAFQPLGGYPQRPSDCRWFVGMGHGIYVPSGESTDRSSPILQREIENSPFDYLALGHHHARKELDLNGTKAVYPGSPTDHIGGGANYVTVELEVAVKPHVTVHTVP